jgi:ankyrin repeat protein
MINNSKIFDQEEGNRQTILIKAAAMGEDDAVRLLLQRNVEVDFQDTKVRRLFSAPFATSQRQKYS